MPFYKCLDLFFSNECFQSIMYFSRSYIYLVLSLWFILKISKFMAVSVNAAYVILDLFDAKYQELISITYILHFLKPPNIKFKGKHAQSRAESILIIKKANLYSLVSYFLCLIQIAKKFITSIHFYGNSITLSKLALNTGTQLYIDLMMQVLHPTKCVL